MTPKNKFTVERLTDAELKKLKKAVLGYGNFSRQAEKAELPKPTLRDVILRGHGKPETIAKVRNLLSNAA
jgi:hypothetical protein